MKEKVTLNSEADVLAVVPKMLGFMPTDSVVVLGISGGPTARLDVAPIDKMTDALAVALRHWSQGVVLVGYDADASLLSELALWFIGNGVPQVVDPIVAEPGEGAEWATGSSLDERTVLKSRAELQRLADDVTDPDEAEAAAILAYQAGNGGLALVFYERAVTLRGGESLTMVALRVALANAIDPRGLQ